jgi:Rrf2 family protein
LEILDMKMTLSARYGLVAAGYIAAHADEGPVTAAKISEEYGIPREFLLKILQQMVRFNVIASKRGPGGGFTLPRPAKEISLLEVIEKADGPIAHSTDLTELTRKTPLTVNLEKACREASEKAVAVFSKATLGQMVGK